MHSVLRDLAMLRILRCSLAVLLSLRGVPIIIYNDDRYFTLAKSIRAAVFHWCFPNMKIGAPSLQDVGMGMHSQDSAATSTSRGARPDRCVISPTSVALLELPPEPGRAKLAIWAADRAVDHEAIIWSGQRP